MNPLNFLSTSNSQSKINQDYFYRLVKPIYGQICWQARLGYGQELCLEIGKKIPYHSPILNGEFKGEWQLGTRASDWAIYRKPDSFVKSSHEETLIKQIITKINGQKIVEIKIAEYTSSFCYLFELGRYSLIIPEQKNNDDLPLWELFLPDRQVLEVFPNLEFQLHSQDEIA